MAASTSILSLCVSVIRRTVLLPWFTGRVVGHPRLPVVEESGEHVKMINTISVKVNPMTLPVQKNAAAIPNNVGGDTISIVAEPFGDDAKVRDDKPPRSTSPSVAKRAKPSGFRKLFGVRKLPTGIVLPGPPTDKTDAPGPPPGNPPTEKRREKPPMYTPGKVRSALGLPVIYKGGTDKPDYTNSAAIFTDMLGNNSELESIFGPAAAANRSPATAGRGISSIGSPVSRTPSISSRFSPRGTPNPDPEPEHLKLHPRTGPTITSALDLDLDRPYDIVFREEAAAESKHDVTAASSYEDEKQDTAATSGTESPIFVDTKDMPVNTEPYRSPLTDFDDGRGASAPAVLAPRREMAHRPNVETVQEQEQKKQDQEQDRGGSTDRDRGGGGGGGGSDELKLDTDIRFDDDLEPGSVAFTEYVSLKTSTQPVTVPPLAVVVSDDKSDEPGSAAAHHPSEVSMRRRTVAGKEASQNISNAHDCWRCRHAFRFFQGRARTTRDALWRNTSFTTPRFDRETLGPEFEFHIEISTEKNKHFRFYSLHETAQKVELGRGLCSYLEACFCS